MYSGFDFKIARIKSKTKSLDLAQQLGISPSKLSLIENGYQKMPKSIYKRLNTIFKDHL